MEKQLQLRAARSPRARRDTLPGLPPEINCYIRRGNEVRKVSREAAIDEFDVIKSLGSGEPTLWIDVLRPGADEEAFLRGGMCLHQLAVEDCMRGRQRPKLDLYSGYFFQVIYTAHLNVERNRVALEELHVFVGNRWIVTVHDQEMALLNSAIERWRSSGGAVTSSAFLAHMVLDSAVDSFLPVIDYLGVHVDEIEHLILTDESEDRMSELLELRHEVAITRRLLSPLQEIIRNMVRRDGGILEEDAFPFFQDVLDHVKRGTEELDALRDTLATTLNAYLSISANKLNYTVRIMAAWSIILMAMAWLAGIYGMNFDIMPELNWRYGYVWALGLMVTVGGGLLFFFRRRGWL